MLVLLHLDAAAPAHLLGIWAPPSAGQSSPRPFYPEPSVIEALAADHISSQGKNRSWGTLVRYLCAASPYFVWWESVEVDDTDDLAGLFAELEPAVFASAAAGDGTVIETTDGMQLKKAMLTEEDKAMLATTSPGAHLAVQLGFPPGRARHTTGRLSTLLDYFDDEHRLLVVAGDPERPEATGLALAHGLAQAGSRDLWLAVPHGHTTPILRRAAFLDRKIRVWSHSDGVCNEVLVPSLPQIFNELKDSIAAGKADLGHRERWVSPILGWATSAPGVVPAHRPGYLAWHCDGRMVLKVTPTGPGLQVTAGVHHAAAPPTPLLVTGPVDPAAVHRVVAASAAACASRLEGNDTANQEHRLQAQLHHRDLNLVHWEREFPARRPVASGGWASLGGDGRGFIDFLGIDKDNDLHVVETKIGYDPMLVLQGLDYWTWAHAHREQLGKHFGVQIRKVILDFVVAASHPGGPVLGPYSAEHAEALAGDIPWRFWTADITGPLPVLKALPKRHIPPGSPRRAPVGFAPWSHTLGDHVALYAASCGHTLTSGVFHQHQDDALLPSARPAAAALSAGGLNHPMLAHIRSSQAFALNLFAGLDETGRLAVLDRLGVAANGCPPATFEWSDPADRLAEATMTSPHQTQVDVVIRPQGADRRHVVLIEVKLSETDFGHCSAYESNWNPDRTACGQPHPFGSNPTGCFQLRNHDCGQPRRYLDVLGPFTGASAGCGCWFRLGTNQVMRNVALARSLVASGDADTVTVALCAPFKHRAIWRRWKEAVTALHGLSNICFAELPADCVAQYHPLDDGRTIADRYLLDRNAVDQAAEQRRWQHWIEDLFPTGAAYVVGPPGWAEPHTHYVGQPVAVPRANGLEVTILPVLHQHYNPTSWTLDPDNLNIETEGDQHRLLIDNAQPCWLTSPGLAPTSPHIDDNYLRDVIRNFQLPPRSDFVPYPLEGIPDLGIGA